jgi:hypothetical protein
VRFTATGRPPRDAVRLAAIAEISSRLEQLRAADQVVCLVESDWATWTFMPRPTPPSELVRMVRHTLRDRDPGWWRIQADGFTATTGADPAA